MQPTEHKEHPVTAMTPFRQHVYRLLASVLFAFFVTGCATVDATFDKVSGKFKKGDKVDGNAVQAVVDEVPASEPPKPVKKPLLVEVQEKLRTLGYYSGPISGKLDSRSEAAIQDFQLDNDLRINGRVTPSLLQEIDKALEQKP